MEMPERSRKRPVDWSKPYWARTGLYVTVTLVSVLVSLIAVGFGCGVLLRAAIPASPMVWRIIELVLNLLITVGVMGYFASREGYSKRKSSGKICVGGGFLFLLTQLPVALVIALAAGPIANTVAELIYFGNQSDYAASLEAAPRLLLLGCMVAADILVLIPAAVLFERLGAQAYRKEQAALIEEARRLQEEGSSEETE